MVLRGSCLCGSVGYGMELPFTDFANCHCSRCRKATGGGFAANAAVTPAAFRCVHSEAEVARFDLPDARSFATAFRRCCGSPMAQPTRSGREIIVPAGSFDDDQRVTPSRHVF